jgi:hypothetical protein
VVDEAHLLDNHQLEAIRLLTLCRAKRQQSSTRRPRHPPLSHPARFLCHTAEAARFEPQQAWIGLTTIQASPSIPPKILCTQQLQAIPTNVIDRWRGNTMRDPMSELHAIRAVCVICCALIAIAKGR